MTQASMRQESDSIGIIDVPVNAYWGAQTQRSIANFPFGRREQMPLPIIHALTVPEDCLAHLARPAISARGNIAAPWHQTNNSGKG